MTTRRESRCDRSQNADPERQQRKPSEHLANGHGLDLLRLVKPLACHLTTSSRRLPGNAPSVCFVSVPDYVHGSNVSYGGTGSDVAASADSTVDASRGLYGDLRLHGCPECRGRGAEDRNAGVCPTMGE